ncbi:GNAT family N-acetyltransferase [bacterium]|nr:GNAT family N-acetyltransferase [bacterium]
MLNALEFFHYSCRFQNHLFVLSLEKGIALRNIINDLRVLNAAQIRCIIVVWNYSELQSELREWTDRGCPFEYRDFSGSDTIDSQQVKDIIASYETGRIPVIGIDSPVTEEMENRYMDRFSMKLVQYFVVDKVFFLSRHDGLYIDNRFISHLTPQEAQNWLEKAEIFNIDKKRLLSFIQGNLENGFEIVLLKGQSGSLFQEIFTHKGEGTLLTSDYPNVIRRGLISDVSDIEMLLKPYMRSGSILTVTEDAIAREVTEYYIYTVNNSIVAIGKLTDHDKAFELAKFCTLPRYQGKGRARELAVEMIKTAREADKEYIFALTVEPKMIDFFESLGFVECDRNILPRQWRQSYDMNRPSKAFRLNIEK